MSALLEFFRERERKREERLILFQVGLNGRRAVRQFESDMRRIQLTEAMRKAREFQEARKHYYA